MVELPAVFCLSDLRGFRNPTGRDTQKERRTLQVRRSFFTLYLYLPSLSPTTSTT